MTRIKIGRAGNLPFENQLVIFIQPWKPCLTEWPGGRACRNIQAVTALHRLHTREIAVIAGRKMFKFGGKLALFEGMGNGDGPEVRAATNPIPREMMCIC